MTTRRHEMGFWKAGNILFLAVGAGYLLMVFFIKGEKKLIFKINFKVESN